VEVVVIGVVIALEVKVVQVDQVLEIITSHLADTVSQAEVDMVIREWQDQHSRAIRVVVKVIQTMPVAVAVVLEVLELMDRSLRVVTAV
jgi:hypothetical protein